MERNLQNWGGTDTCVRNFMVRLCNKFCWNFCNSRMLSVHQPEIPSLTNARTHASICNIFGCTPYR